MEPGWSNYFLVCQRDYQLMTTKQQLHTYYMCHPALMMHETIYTDVKTTEVERTLQLVTSLAVSAVPIKGLWESCSEAEGFSSFYGNPSYILGRIPL